MTKKSKKKNNFENAFLNEYKKKIPYLLLVYALLPIIDALL